MDYESLSIAELESHLDDLDAARLAGEPFDGKLARSLMAIRARKIQEENAHANGVTVEDYAQAKAAAEADRDREDGKPFHWHLSQARKDQLRQLQVARAGQARVGAEVKGA